MTLVFPLSAVLLLPGSTTPSRTERLAALPAEERVWLTEFVAPTILPEEEQLFLELTEGYQREIFKKAFWDRREEEGLPPPFGPGFQRRYEELRPRLDTEYDGWRSDPGRMVLHYGEPADLHRVTCPEVFRDLEIWTYRSAHGAGSQTLHHLFYRPEPGSPRRLWVSQATLSRSDKPGAEVFVADSCRSSFPELLCGCSQQCRNDPCLGITCPEACDVYKVYQEIVAREGTGLGSIERQTLLQLPKIPEEAPDRLRSRFPGLPAPGAKPLHAVGPAIATAEPTPTPEPKRSLSPEEIKLRIDLLEPKYRQFVDLAAPLLTQAELSDFLELAPAQKDRFIVDFWKRFEK